mgnify:CR=1 FL=1
MRPASAAPTPPARHLGNAHLASRRDRLRTRLRAIKKAQWHRFGIDLSDQQLKDELRIGKIGHRMQLLHQCLPLSRVLGSLHRVRPQRPPPRLRLRLAHRLYLSPILVRPRPSGPTNAAVCKNFKTYLKSLKTYQKPTQN